MKQIPGIKLLSVLFCLAGLGFFLGGNYIHLKAMLAQHLMERAWAQTLEGEAPARPWPWADSYPVARLTMKRLDVDMIVQEGDQGAVLAFGPGHLSESTLPPEVGNCIMVGHRDTSFKFLQYLETGDVLQLQSADGIVHTYKVEGREVRDHKDLYFGQEPDWLSLVTCYPFAGVDPGTPLRFVVSARKIREAGV